MCEKLKLEKLHIGDINPTDFSRADVFGVYVQYPNAWGLIYNQQEFIAAAHAKNILVAIGTDLLSLTLLTSPGEMGADVVVNHQDLINEIRNEGFQFVDFILDFVDTSFYWDSMAELIKPQGHIASITGSSIPLLLNKLKSKSVSFSWELMYTRSMFQTEDMIQQHHILNQVADLLDEGVLVGTLKETLHGLSADVLKKAHKQLESGKTIGKLAIKF